MDSLQRDLDIILKRANEWQLLNAIDKNCILHLGIHNPYHEYTLNNVPIAAVNSMKDLAYISLTISLDELM